VHEVLVDGGQFILELRLQVREGLGVAFHGSSFLVGLGSRPL
jgi:hypothetical protein